MNLSYYTIDDVNLGPGRLFHRGWKLERFQTLEEALARYRSLPSSAVKALGLTDGVHVLELVQCLPLFPDDKEGENVLASDCRTMPRWESEPEAVRASDYCTSVLRLRYIVDGDILAPIQASDQLPKRLRDKYLWLNVLNDPMSAIRWVYVAGKGWLSPSVLKKPANPKYLVLKFRVDGVTDQGAYLSMEMEPWEYKLLLRRTLERLEQNKNKEAQKK